MDRFALFSECLLTGVWIAVAALPLVTFPAAFAAGPGTCAGTSTVSRAACASSPGTSGRPPGADGSPVRPYGRRRLCSLSIWRPSGPDCPAGRSWAPSASWP